mmetsp:Transcript_2959/g.4990  ORF Transcript_2959/g.4990 Transcript_2959/m.4990 type:complete len:521 (-) Transcript_2959:368-1930(-)
MVTLQLPRPAREYTVKEDAVRPSQAGTVSVSTSVLNTFSVPRYRHRKGFLPRKPEDHGDGGAFPEIHVAQYPLGMGKKGNKGGNALALTVGQSGKVEFDALVKRGHKSVGGMVQTRYEDLVAKNSTAENNESLAVPGEAEELETAKRTGEVLSRIVGRKLEASRAVKVVDNSAAAGSIAKPKYIAYQPQGTGNAGKQGRIIRVVEAQADPLEPPKFRHHKQPRTAPTEAPAPILHAPTEKLTEEDKKAWVIPPSISSWKNPQGHIIPLDKRLAADGRGLEQKTVSDKFAALSEAMYIAENQSRAEIESRNREKAFLLQKEKEHKEDELRELAAQARRERQEAHNFSRHAEDLTDREPRASERNEEDTNGEREREAIRQERKRERERSIRLEAAGKKSKLARDEERDVSEKVALGMAVPKTSAISGEAAYDSRLFNQSEGLGSGFGADDDYNVYSKPLFHSQSSGQYRPKSSNDVGFGTTNELDKIRGADTFTTDVNALPETAAEKKVDFSKLASKKPTQD